MNATKEVDIMTHDHYREYQGWTLNPQYANNQEIIMRKNAYVRATVGHEPVLFGHMVMSDPAPAFGNEAVDVVQQYELKKFTFLEKTAVTAAVDLLAGYVAGTTVIHADTVAGGYGLQEGDTISITTAAVAYYYLIESIVYDPLILAGTEVDITLAWGLQVAAVDNDVITTGHVANAPRFFPKWTEFFANAKLIKNAKWFDASGPGTTVFQIIDAPNTVPTAGVSLVPGNFGGVANEDHFIGVFILQALATGDMIELWLEFFDDLIRLHTIGQSLTSGAIRTSATVANDVSVELRE
jgi:hypothetical protein